MTTTAPQTTTTPHSAAIQRTAPPQRRPTSRDPTSWVEILQETAPIIVAPALFGPPIIFVLGPWLLLALLLMGAFTLMITVLLVLALASGLLAACALVLASPVLVIRHCRARSAANAKTRAARQRLQTDHVGSSRRGPARAHPVKEPSHA